MAYRSGVIEGIRRVATPLIGGSAVGYGAYEGASKLCEYVFPFANTDWAGGTDVAAAIIKPAAAVLAAAATAGSLIWRRYARDRDMVLDKYRPGMTPVQVSQGTGVPLRRTGNILRRAERRGYIQLSPPCTA